MAIGLTDDQQVLAVAVGEWAGGSLLDLAVAVEACAHAVVPGALVPTAAAALTLTWAEQRAGDVADVVRGSAAGTETVAVGLGTSTLTATDGGWSGSASGCVGRRCGQTAAPTCRTSSDSCSSWYAATASPAARRSDLLAIRLRLPSLHRCQGAE
jgi:hypothetical protein